jgi:UDP-N-acetylglucosamine 2-epimerase (non-hydrolysing)
MPKLLLIFGTRPEAIKLCPLVREFRRHPDMFEVRVCVTAQHRHMLDQVLKTFSVRPDYDLDLMQSGQTLLQASARILSGLEPVLEAERPAMVVVQGDTTTTLCGALASFYKQIPVAHVEAGLRTYDLSQPFPEEINRVLTGRLATLHFAATEGAAQNLRSEGVPSSAISVTGNTGIDAVLQVCAGLEQGVLPAQSWPLLSAGKKLILVTAHRRESFGDKFEQICYALLDLAKRPDVQIVYPVHPNPNVQDPVNRLLLKEANITLIEPAGYVEFVDLMRRAYLIVTDSGGIQEEAPSLGKPVLVLREKTERPEAVLAGTVKLVGADRHKIVREATALLDDRAKYEALARVHNPYGDGLASIRISTAIASFFGR